MNVRRNRNNNFKKELILEALDRREDRALSRIGHEREERSEAEYTHEDVWK